MRKDCDWARRSCELYSPGHHMHWIHVRRVGERPWGWRDAVVRRVEGLHVVVDHLLEPGSPRLWHHEDLSAELAVGDPVRVHEEYWALGTPGGWLNVALAEGVGAVPTPEETDVWAGEVTGGVQDLSTGRGLPLDHLR